MNTAPPSGVAARLATDRERLLDRLESAAQRMKRRSDTEASHDVRVTTRRIDALLDVWRPFLAPARRRKARRALRALRRALGPARELRVGIDLLRERLPAAPPGVRPAIAVVIEQWEHDLVSVEQGAAARCGRRDVRGIRRRIERVFPDLPRGPVADIRLASAGRARLEERQQRAVRVVRRAGEDPSDERLHAARVAIKRWRYGIERTDAADPGPASGMRETLVGFQQWLGRVQDLAVLRGALRAIGTRLDQAGIPDGAAAFVPFINDLEREREACVEAFLRLVAAADLGGTQLLSLRQGRHASSD